MNQALAGEVVSCLRVGGASELSLARLRAFGRLEWAGSLSWLDQSGLALYFWQRLKELGAESAIPLQLQARLAKNLEDNRLRVAEMAEEFDQLNLHFGEAGVEYAALKGFALIPEYCPEASLRTQYDYDYVVRPQSLDRAEQVLRAAGYIRKKLGEDHPVVYYRPTLPLPLPSCAEGLFSAQLQRTVELHLRLGYAEQEKICLGAPEDALDRAGWRTWEGRSFRGLTDEDALSFQVLHAFRHILHNWCRLSVFLEIAHFLERRSADSEFWRRFAERAGGLPRMADAGGVVLSLVARLFGGRVPGALSAWTTEPLPPALTLWVERYGVFSALENFSGNKFSLFLHREFIQDPDAWRAIQRRRLLPLHWPHRVAQATSPQLRSRLKAGRKQGFHSLRRLAFHGAAVFRYFFELPRWNRVLRQEAGEHAGHDWPSKPSLALLVSARHDERRPAAGRPVAENAALSSATRSDGRPGGSPRGRNSSRGVFSWTRKREAAEFKDRE